MKRPTRVPGVITRVEAGVWVSGLAPRLSSGATLSCALRPRARAETASRHVPQASKCNRALPIWDSGSVRSRSRWNVFSLGQRMDLPLRLLGRREISQDAEIGTAESQVHDADRRAGPTTEVALEDGLHPDTDRVQDSIHPPQHRDTMFAAGEWNPEL